MIVPLDDPGERYGNPAGSKRAVQLATDRSVIVLGETGSGKTEGIKVLAVQLQNDENEPYVVFDYKEDYQEFIPEREVIKLSMTDPDVTWNVFMEIEAEDDCDEIAKAVFSGAEDEYFNNAAAQVLADVLRLILRRSDSSAQPTNADLVGFLDGIDAAQLRTWFDAEGLSAEKHLQPGVEATSNIVSILEERVKAVFRGRFAESGSFSIREYMGDPQGKILILDFPIQQSESVQAIFRLLLDWSIRFGLEDERNCYYLLDEFAALPRLEMLERLINAGRAYNCYAIFGVQAIPQLEETYGKAGAESLLSGMAQEIHLRVGQESVEYCRRRLGRNRVERDIGPSDGEDENDKRVFEEYPVGEDTLQTLAAGRAIVHTPEGRQWGRIIRYEEIGGRLQNLDIPTESPFQILKRKYSAVEAHPDPSHRSEDH